MWRIATPCLFLAACSHGPALSTYRLVHQDRLAILVPPNVKGPEMTRRTFVAQGVARGKGACDTVGPVAIDARKSKLRVTVDGASLREESQAAWLADWTIGAEARGCIAAGQAAQLAERIVESVPLDSDTAYRLLYPNGIRCGYVELGPDNQLEVRSAIMRDGDANAPIGDITGISGSERSINVDLKLSESVVGFETAWYSIRADGAGTRFVPIAADRNIQGNVTHTAAPDADYLRFAPQARYVRLFYKADDNGVTAILIAGATRPDLDARTKAVSADSAACERQAGMCVLIPRRMGVNPLLVVKVNGREVRAGLGATVRNAIFQSGEHTPESVIPRLTVMKPYAGQPRLVEFDSRTQDILNLKLMGGETISWK